MMKSEDGEVCEWCTAVIEDGSLTVHYQWAGMLDGADAHDENVDDWSDKEIRDLVGDIVGIKEGRSGITIDRIS